MWKAYGNIKHNGYRHNTLNRSETYEEEYGSHTNNIEAKWSGLKGNISKNKRKNTHCTEQVLTLIWRHQNKDDIWSAFVRALAKIQYIDHNNLEDNDELEIDVRPPVIEIEPKIEVSEV